MILLFYFGLSALGRIWAIIVFVTPSLGLFDTMFHAWFGRLEPSESVLYDFFPNGTDIQMADAWKPFQFSPFDTVFYSVPLWSTLPLLVALHVLIQLAIAKKFKTHPAKEARHWHVLYTLVCPPLFLDWQEMYSAGSGHGLSPQDKIKDCWIWSWSAYLSSVFLFVSECAILSWPIAMLKIFITVRKADMQAAYFPQVPEEDLSERNVNLILLTYPLVLVVLPLIQICLAYAYFKQLHPWARIIKNVDRRDPPYAGEETGPEEED